jgi:hypothetical protein
MVNLVQSKIKNLHEPRRSGDRRADRQRALRDIDQRPADFDENGEFGEAPGGGAAIGLPRLRA